MNLVQKGERRGPKHGQKGEVVTGADSNEAEGDEDNGNEQE